MADRAVLCVVAMEAALAESMGILRLKLSRLCATRIDHHLPNRFRDRYEAVPLTAI
jgi:hypothetical protein